MFMFNEELSWYISIFVEEKELKQNGNILLITQLVLYGPQNQFRYSILLFVILWSDLYACITGSSIHPPSFSISNVETMTGVDYIYEYPCKWQTSKK